MLYGLSVAVSKQTIAQIESFDSDCPVLILALLAI
jgi:DNA-binding XRE family transcriptional regulator